MVQTWLWRTLQERALYIYILWNPRLASSVKHLHNISKFQSVLQSVYEIYVYIQSHIFYAFNTY